ncbi:hypothetical protein LTR56_000481 [Elasticomyces elasticus]|nr:hypothetical protein LTR22_014209 [Elasticomyces elasticus]KAK3660723.1 hypothetical protein LTR56_000481 [Elasticomyces elasticus]KAK4922869.1 hypothetical protein LTR49_009876 [Elasticomyces elasticus]KAK5759755.1 hypothetical protein LTS12_010095 [Elasticomyces elasticus]
MADPTSQEVPNTDAKVMDSAPVQNTEKLEPEKPSSETKKIAPAEEQATQQESGQAPSSTGRDSVAPATSAMAGDKKAWSPCGARWIDRFSVTREQVTRDYAEELEDLAALIEPTELSVEEGLFVRERAMLADKYGGALEAAVDLPEKYLVLTEPLDAQLDEIIHKKLYGTIRYFKALQRFRVKNGQRDQALEEFLKASERWLRGYHGSETSESIGPAAVSFREKLKKAVGA